MGGEQISSTTAGGGGGGGGGNADAPSEEPTEEQQAAEVQTRINTSLNVLDSEYDEEQQSPTKYNSEVNGYGGEDDAEEDLLSGGEDGEFDGHL